MNRQRPPEDFVEPDERSARELIGDGTSQIEHARASRVRDINRPSAEELAEAQQSVQVVHRNWKPTS